MEIEGKKAVVVGGASGFGRATAEALAKRGAAVAVLDRPQSNGKEVAAEIGGTFHEVDVTDFEGTEAVLNAAVDTLGGLHIAVTTAGRGIAERTVKKDGPHSLDSFRKSIDLNLIGTFNTIRLAAARMAELEPVDGERGVAIGTASVAAYDGQIGQVVGQHDVGPPGEDQRLRSGGRDRGDHLLGARAGEQPAGHGPDPQRGQRCHRNILGDRHARDRRSDHGR